MEVTQIAQRYRDRLWAGALADGSGCWIWQRAHQGIGYGALKVDGKMRGAHRLAYQIVKGPIPDGLQIDHLCRVRNCINPDHLEAVTQQENMRRGFGATALNARKARCEKGHEYTHAVGPRGPYRYCATCRRTNQRAVYHRNKAMEPA